MEKVITGQGGPGPPPQFFGINKVNVHLGPSFFWRIKGPLKLGPSNFKTATTSLEIQNQLTKIILQQCPLGYTSQSALDNQLNWLVLITPKRCC